MSEHIPSMIGLLQEIVAELKLMNQKLEEIKKK